MDMRIPKNDADAEQYVLASIIFDPEIMPSINAILDADDFYRPDNAEIYRALKDMYTNGDPIDFIALNNALIKRGALEKCGGYARIAEISASFYTTVNAKHHAIEIRRLAESRRLLKSLTTLINNPDDISVDNLKAITQEAEKNQYIRSYADRAVRSIDCFKNGLRVKKMRIATGFSTLDAVTGGLRIPSVAMIGAYPSVGKTAFSLNITAAQTNPVVFFSLEMSCDMIYERLASAELKIDYNLFTTQRLNDRHYRDVDLFADKLKNKGVHVFDDVYFIEQQASIIASVKPVLVVVDYVQKVKTHQRTDSRRIEIDAISGLYKQIAKNNNCVILLLSQLSRPDKQSKTIKPTMASLKESGALEADGDYIGILHRPYVLHKDEPDKIKPEDGYILIDKNKFGHTGHIDVYFDGRYQRFREIDKSETWSNEKLPVDDDDLPFD